MLEADATAGIGGRIVFSFMISSIRLILFLTMALAAVGSAAGGEPQREKAPAANPSPAASAAKSDGDYLRTIESQNRVVADLVRAEVDRELRAARSRMATNPAAVERELKLMVSRVARTPELSADERLALVGQLDAAISQSRRLTAAKTVAGQHASETQTSSADRLRAADRLSRDQQRGKQSTESYQSLLDQGRHIEAESLGSSVIRPLVPDSPVAVSAPLVAEQAGGRSVSLARRSALRKAYLDTMASVENSAIPSSDDRPIVYPDAETWRKLTAWRRAHSPVDMHKVTAAEAKIRQALKEPTEIDFDETPLEDVVKYLKDLHGIEIQLDARSLADANVESGIPVTRKVKGISLRSALHLILNDLNLTYLISDEVLLITTPDRASRTIETRVYPVIDLVLPANPREFGR